MKNRNERPSQVPEKEKLNIEAAKALAMIIRMVYRIPITFIEVIINIGRKEAEDLLDQAAEDYDKNNKL